MCYSLCIVMINADDAMDDMCALYLAAAWVTVTIQFLLVYSGCIKTLAYSNSTHKLFSTADDGKLATWDLESERQEVCSLCVYVCTVCVLAAEK